MIEEYDKTRYKREYLLLWQCFAGDKPWQWVTPPVKVLHYLPPVLVKNGNDYYLTILSRIGTDGITLVFNYCYSLCGDCASSLGVGMCSNGLRSDDLSERYLVNLAKEVRRCFFIKASRNLAKFFLEEVYPETAKRDEG